MPRFYLNRTVTVSFILNACVFYDLGQPNSDIKTALDLGAGIRNHFIRSSFRTVVNNAFSGKLVTFWEPPYSNTFLLCILPY
jgi:hypothetical protein